MGMYLNSTGELPQFVSNESLGRS